MGQSVDIKVLQKKIYNFLERPAGWCCFFYHFSIFLAVLFCLVIGVVCTISEYEEKITNKFIYVEITLLIFFATEYVVRVWSSGARAKFKGWIGRLLFIKTPISMVDLFVIVASSSVIAFHMTGKLGSANTVMAAPALRIIRFFQILRMLHVDRHAHSWKLLITVAYMHRIELITTMYMGFVFLIFTAYLIYIAERDFKMPDGHRPFESYADALWFGIVTVATIGYGDKTPHTWPGRIITACLSIIGIAFFALPAGILGSGFALHVQQKERQKLYHKQYPASASLIQAAWRVHATTNLTANNATWRLYKLVDPQLANRSLLISRNIPPLRQRRSIFHNLDADAATQQLLLGTRQSTAIVDDLPDRFKQAIRVIRQMKFFVARRKFQEVRKPTDMTEIAKQTVEDNQAIMIKLKELQRRLDTTLGGASLDRESTSDAFRKSNRSRSVRFTQQHHQLHIEQQPLTISDQLKGVQDRLTVIEQTLSKFTSIISRIDEKTNARRLTDVI